MSVSARSASCDPASDEDAQLCPQERWGGKAPALCSRHHEDKFMWLSPSEAQHGCRDFCWVWGTDGGYSMSWQVVSLIEHLKGAPCSLLFKAGDTGSQRLRVGRVVQ